MKRIGSFALMSVLLLGLPALGQQSGTSTVPVTDRSGIPTVQAQRKLFTSRLDLSNDQQNKLLPILEELHDATARAVHDDSMPARDRLLQVHGATGRRQENPGHPYRRAEEQARRHRARTTPGTARNG